jgi:hypothetical protein
MPVVRSKGTSAKSPARKPVVHPAPKATVRVAPRPAKSPKKHPAPAVSKVVKPSRKVSAKRTSTGGDATVSLTEFHRNGGELIARIARDGGKVSVLASKGAPVLRLRSAARCPNGVSRVEAEHHIVFDQYKKNGRDIRALIQIGEAFVIRSGRSEVIADRHPDCACEMSRRHNARIEARTDTLAKLVIDFVREAQNAKDSAKKARTALLRGKSKVVPTPRGTVARPVPPVIEVLDDDGVRKSPYRLLEDFACALNRLGDTASLDLADRISSYVCARGAEGVAGVKPLSEDHLERTALD